jgi:hypothetical protein
MQKRSSWLVIVVFRRFKVGANFDNVHLSGTPAGSYQRQQNLILRFSDKIWNTAHQINNVDETRLSSSSSSSSSYTVHGLGLVTGSGPIKSREVF